LLLPGDDGGSCRQFHDANFTRPNDDVGRHGLLGRPVREFGLEQVLIRNARLSPEAGGVEDANFAGRTRRCTLDQQLRVLREADHEEGRLAVGGRLLVAATGLGLLDIFVEVLPSWGLISFQSFSSLALSAADLPLFNSSSHFCSSAVTTAPPSSVAVSVSALAVASATTTLSAGQTQTGG
jgi:hypothetical protein